MSIKKLIAWVAAIIMFSACTAEGQLSVIPLSDAQIINHANVQTDPELGTVRFMKGADLSAQLAKNSEFITMQAEGRHVEIAMAFLQSIANILRLDNPQQELAVQKTNQDDLGMTHIYFGQVYQNIPVLRAELSVHLNKANQVTSVQGHYSPSPKNLNLSPKLDAATIQKKVVENIGAATANGCDSRLVITSAGSPQSERLAYQVTCSSTISGGWILVLDANTGEIIEKISAMQTLISH